MEAMKRCERLTLVLFYFVIILNVCSVRARTFQHEVWDNVRLVNGSSVNEGRVEVNINGTWGTVCDVMWTMFDGYVVCRQLGFDGVQAVYKGAHFGAGGGPIFHTHLRCNKTESDLDHCRGIHDPQHTNCTHQQDAGVKCVVPHNRHVHTSTCHKNQLLCFSDNKCIPTRWACDHQLDCSNHEDESLSICQINNVCGKQYTSQEMSRRIVNGNDASLGTWPWMTSLMVKLPMTGNEVAFCGGTLIQTDWVLTAAHCFDNYNPSTSTFRVLLGSVDVHGSAATRQEVSVQHVYLHNMYRSDNHRNDIALLKLTHPVHTGGGTCTAPACLPVFTDTPFNSSDTCYITGWGTTHSNVRTTILQQAEVPILDNVDCTRWYNTSLSDGMMCAGYQYGGIDACHGDSGGPLSCLRNGRWFVAGIVSWGHGCAKHPGIYTDVRQYVTWIHYVIKSSQTIAAAPSIVGR